MNAIELLHAQHQEVAKLFKQIEKAEGAKRKGELFQELAADLCAHDAIERQIFYPACEKEMGMTDLLGESLVEHGLVEFCLYQADQAQGAPDFDFKVTVLKEIVEHHVEEEQDELFPKVRKALGAELLDQLGEQMEAKFEEAKQKDFRGPLHDNLRQVLQGALKTAPPGAKKAAPRPRAHASH